MATLRFALAQFDFPVGAIAANADRVRVLMRDARAGGADLLVCPELALSGYPPEDLLLRPSFLAACQSEMDNLATEADGLAALVGFPHSAGVVYNAAALLRDGRVAQIAHKLVLPNYGVFDDKRWFEPGHAVTVTTLHGVRVGLLICEDAWQPEPIAAAARAGAEMVVVINASPFDTAKQAQREALLAARAMETGCAIAYLNMVGGQDDVVYDGASLLVNGDGSVAARAPAFVDVLLWAEFDSGPRKWAARDWATAADTSTEALLYAALVRGVRDYVAKNGFEGVLLGLSGGIDSALTLAIAVDALGADKVTAVMLPSRYTSDLSLREAHAQARTLGISRRIDRGRRGRCRCRIGARVRRVGGSHGTEPAGAQPRRAADGIVEPDRQVVADHRQQERDGGRLRNAVRRHVRRLCAVEGCLQDAGVCLGKVAQWCRKTGKTGGRVHFRTPAPRAHCFFRESAFCPRFS
jgi:NAD+ synthase (glutamine-hydrolysing)